MRIFGARFAAENGDNPSYATDKRREKTFGFEKGRHRNGLHYECMGSTTTLWLYTEVLTLSFLQVFGVLLILRAFKFSLGNTM